MNGSAEVQVEAQGDCDVDDDAEGQDGDIPASPEAAAADWLEIGRDHQPSTLETTRDEIARKWPGRYDFKIERTRIGAIERHYRLELRHRDL